jgi:hypothetical protein
MMEDQDEIIFRRFPLEKKNQVRHLVSWARLLGLTGPDLVSIGGKLDRSEKQQELRRNKEIAKSMWHRVTMSYHGRFQYTDPESGRVWLIESKWASGWMQITVSRGTKTVKVTPRDYHCGTSADAWIRQVLVNIHYGDLDLVKLTG